MFLQQMQDYSISCSTFFLHPIIEMAELSFRNNMQKHNLIEIREYYNQYNFNYYLTGYCRTCLIKHAT